MTPAALAAIDGCRAVNIASRFWQIAAEVPDQRAIVFPWKRDGRGRRSYTHLTFAQAAAKTNRIARGLQGLGIGPGTRTVLMVRPSLDFIPLTFALFSIGAVPVLIDPGMGRKRMLQSIEKVEPEAFIGVSEAHAFRTLFSRSFSKVRQLVTVGRRWWWGGATLDDLLREDDAPVDVKATDASDLAAILFTTGSTGPPKGVEYTHGIFDAQTDTIGQEWGIEKGEVDLPVFPLFGLFSCALGATIVVPDMDPTRPARADASKIVEAIEDNGVTYSFGSPTFWNRVAAHCVERGVVLRSVGRVFMAGAPVAPDLIRRMQSVLPSDADVFIPYGATESLPVSWIRGSEVVAETAERTESGAGHCVGRPITTNRIRVIEIDDGPLKTMSAAREVVVGEVGEIAVQGPVVTRRYYGDDKATELAKLDDNGAIWHRMGDVGYVDEMARLWFCGRKAHRVQTAEGPLYSVCCEAIYNAHPRVFRSALVGLGPRGSQTPVILIECVPERAPKSRSDEEALRAELLALGRTSEVTTQIDRLLFHPSFPVDIRHNAKIFREKLAVWAEGQVAK